MSMDNSVSSRVQQDQWSDSPCSQCLNTPCCKRVPLMEYPWKTQSDIHNLLQLLTFYNLEAGIKRNGKLALFYRQQCRNLINDSGKCSIFSSSDQSLVCKMYNAHLCWYRKAFNGSENPDMIRFDFNRMEQLYKALRFGDSGQIALPPQWDDLRNLAAEIPYTQPRQSFVSSSISKVMSFSQLCSTDVLLFPPIKKPETLDQCDLIRFRLGFYGLYLAITDTHWFFIHTGKKDASLEMKFIKMFPDLESNESFSFGFKQWFTKNEPSSLIGQKAVIIQYEDIPVLINNMTLSEEGYILRHPGTRDLMHILGEEPPHSPVNAA